jgi:hypothetical protein
MKTPLVTEVEIIYDRESESPLPTSVIDFTFTKEGRRARSAPEALMLGDGLDLEDPMVSHYADTGSQLGMFARRLSRLSDLTSQSRADCSFE